ncbi:heparinase II/III family protein [Actinacidiphila bryophytorum]|nr:heparinase II/III family protein [Actinacidiphila bryophytorum]MBM9437115.1 heparinase II/III family protein [Actinacidiphila bryophytorum]MBN6542050.1 heparinase II/III family protein [Actinacidiphila bryophytorum]
MPSPPSAARPLSDVLGLAPGQAVAAGVLRDPAARAPVPRVGERGVWDAVDAATRSALLKDADAELARNAPVLRASDWARTFRDGVRTAYEDQARALRSRTALFVLAAVLADEAAPAGAPPGAAPYLDAAADGLLAFAEAGTWCWAPHDRHTAGRGEVVPDPDDPFLDLGAAEVASLAAWADHVLGERFDQRVPGLRRRLRREVRQRVLAPFLRTRDWHWIGLDGDAHNWNPWIHSAVLTAALLLTDDDAERAEVVSLVVRGLDHFVAVLPDDGGVDEGVAYWWQGACRLLESLDLLAAVGGPALDARGLPVLPELLRYPHRMHWGGPWYVNVGDAPARPPAEQPWHVLFHWGRRLGDPGVTAHAVARARARGVTAHQDDGLGRALAALSAPGWQAALADPPPADSWAARDVWLPRVELLVARERAGSTQGLALAVKGGHNAERHNHLDVGSYWVALDGAPVVVDIGQPTYTAASFGPDRYRAWPLRSGWHNVPEPGAEQQPGAHHRAHGVRAEIGEDATVWTADLAAAYPTGLLAGWRRTVRLVRAAGGGPAYVLVEDEPQRAPAVLRLHHVVAGEVTVGEGRADVRAGGGRALQLTWDHRQLTGSAEVRALDDLLLRHSWGDRLTRLTLHAAPGVQGPLRVRIERPR